jgi:hypothetical protein
VGPRAGPDDVEKRKFLTMPGLELRPLGRPARSQSLYRLRYPSFHKNVKSEVSASEVHYFYIFNELGIYFLKKELEAHKLFIVSKKQRHHSSTETAIISRLSVKSLRYE